MACNSAQSSFYFNDLVKETKFISRQLRSIYQHFCRFSHSKPNLLNFVEFKECCGIFGKSSKDFICKRLMTLISNFNSEVVPEGYVSFSSYVKFLNLINYGTTEEKLRHTFSFMDLKKTGYIDKEDFVTVLYSICDFVSTVSNSKLNTSEQNIETLFDDLLQRYSSGKVNQTLNFQTFSQIFSSSTDEFDLFNIFYNKFEEESKVILKRDQVMILEKCDAELKMIEDELRNPQANNSNAKIVTKESSHHMSQTNPMNINQSTLLKPSSIKQNEIIFRNVLPDSNQNKSDIKRRPASKLKDYNIQQTVPTFLKFENANNPDMLSKNGIDIHSEIEDKDENIQTESLLMTEEASIKKTENSGFEFNFMSLSNSMYSEHEISCLKKVGLEPNSILIIKNKNEFLEKIESIHMTLRKLTQELKNNKKHNKRRQGFSLNIESKTNLNNEDFFNSYSGDTSDDRGLVHLGSPNIDLVLNMMLGIKSSINSEANSKSNIMYNFSLIDAFNEVSKFTYIIGIPQSTSISNSGQNPPSLPSDSACEFVDVAPKVFDNLRRMYGISSEKYLKSLGPENFVGNLVLTNNRSLKELVSTGKSGSFFYFSYDSKYLLKTISQREFYFFKNILQDYYNYMLNNPETLVQRYYGLHSMTLNKQTIYFVVMNNCFNTNLKLSYKYDLKGSSYQRLSREPSDINYEKYDFCIPLKDNDLRDRKEFFVFEKIEKDQLLDQLERDSKFLATKNINDYSLIIGVHIIETTNKGNLKNQLIQEALNLANGTDDIPCRHPFYESMKGGMITKDLTKILYLGVIDIFTVYAGKKKLEHAFKSIFQGRGISCQPPDDYSQRFLSFVNEIFKGE